MQSSHVNVFGRFGLFLTQRLSQWTWGLVVASLWLTQTVVTPSAKDSFRLPKDLIVRAEASVLFGLILVAVVLGKRPEVKALWRVEVVLPISIVMWTLVTTVFSTNRRLSIYAVAWTCQFVLIFWTTCYLIQRRSAREAVNMLLVPGCVNAAVLLSQASGLWNPFTFAASEAKILQRSALIGNPNEVGSYLVPILIVAATASATFAERRGVYVATTAVLSLALLVARSETAIMAGIVGVGALIALRSKTGGIVFLVSLVLLITGAVVISTPVAHSVEKTLYQLRTGQFDVLLSHRLSSFVVAWELVKTYPVFGAGPGTFHWHYFDTRLAVGNRYSTLLDTQPAALRFSEVHNDHLEILGETGIPGYLLFLASLWALAKQSLATSTANELDQDRVSRLLSLPLALSLFVLALAQFPLQTAATTSVFVYAAALSVVPRRSKR